MCYYMYIDYNLLILFRREIVDIVINRNRVSEDTIKEIFALVEEGERDFEENAVYDSEEVFDEIERGDDVDML